MPSHITQQSTATLRNTARHLTSLSSQQQRYATQHAISHHSVVSSNVTQHSTPSHITQQSTATLRKTNKPSASSNLRRRRSQSLSSGRSRSHTSPFTLAMTQLSARPWLQSYKYPHNHSSPNVQCAVMKILLNKFSTNLYSSSDI